MKWCLFIAFLVYSNVASLAQNWHGSNKPELPARIDSVKHGLFRAHEQAHIAGLKKELQKEKIDSAKVKLLIQISSSFPYNNDSSVYYGEKAAATAGSIHWKKGIALAYKNIQLNYIRNIEYISDSGKTVSTLESRNYAKRLEYGLKALKIYEEINEKAEQPYLLRDIANLYFEINDYAKAAEYAAKIIKVANETGNKKVILESLFFTQGIYSRIGNNEKMLDCYFKELEIYKDFKDTGRMIVTWERVRNYYDNQKKDSEVFDCELKIAALEARTTYTTFGTMQRAEKVDKNRFDEYLIVNKINKDYASLVSTPALSTTEKNKIYDIEINRATDEAEKQALLETQQQQALQLNKQRLELAEQDKNLLFLTQQKTEAQLQAEQSRRAENEKQLTIAQKEKALQTAELNLKNKTIQNNALQRNVFIGLGVILGALSLFVYKSLHAQKKSNSIISKEKKRSEDLLLNILPSEVAEELKEKGSASAKYFDHVTVLFTDFVGFTKAGERMSPQQLVDELDGCFKEFDRITSKYGIEKIKTIGDAYLAVGGLPIAIPNHAECAVSAAIEIRDFMQQRKKQLGDNTFEVRIGVHTGSVVAGIVGVRKFAYDIWGDTVNTAARIEQNSEAGKVNVSQTTYDLIKDKFDCTYRGEIDAKNKGEMSMYFVERFIRA